LLKRGRSPQSLGGTGAAFGDTLTGDAGNSALEGGVDQLCGGAGADTGRARFRV